MAPSKSTYSARLWARLQDQSVQPGTTRRPRTCAPERFVHRQAPRNRGKAQGDRKHVCFAVVLQVVPPPIEVLVFLEFDPAAVNEDVLWLECPSAPESVREAIELAKDVLIGGVVHPRFPACQLRLCLGKICGRVTGPGEPSFVWAFDFNENRTD